MFAWVEATQVAHDAIQRSAGCGGECTYTVGDAIGSRSLATRGSLLGMNSMKCWRERNSHS